MFGQRGERASQRIEDPRSHGPGFGTPVSLFGQQAAGAPTLLRDAREGLTATRPRPTREMNELDAQVTWRHFEHRRF
jgi:hypothetical protein